VDGSHQYEIVKQDAQLARKLAMDGAVIAFDDYRSAHVPGVAAAVWSEVVDGDLKPIALTRKGSTRP
jgi:hypothetical protein